MTIRVAIADDHSLVRQGLRRYLDMAEGIEVVGEASNGLELLELVERETPEIALVDIRMPEMDGLEAARQIRERFPNVGVIMLTAYDDRQFVVEAVRSGAIIFATSRRPGAWRAARWLGLGVLAIGATALTIGLLHANHARVAPPT